LVKAKRKRERAATTIIDAIVMKIAPNQGIPEATAVARINAIAVYIVFLKF